MEVSFPAAVSNSVTDMSHPSANTLDATNAAHAFSAVARDAAGNLTTSTAVSVTVSNPDTTAPTITISSPPNGAALSGTTTVTATASDNVGVVGVQFKVDGVNMGTEDTTAPSSTSWSTTTATDAAHSLSTVEKGEGGN